MIEFLMVLGWLSIGLGLVVWLKEMEFFDDDTPLLMPAVLVVFWPTIFMFLSRGDVRRWRRDRD